MLIDPIEFVKLLFSASTALAGILIGALFVVYGIAEAQDGGALKVSDFYRTLLWVVGGLAALPIITIGLSLLFLFGKVTFGLVLAFFSLSGLGLLATAIGGIISLYARS